MFGLDSKKIGSENGTYFVLSLGVEQLRTLKTCFDKFLFSYIFFAKVFMQISTLDDTKKAALLVKYSRSN